jgi:signal transduction histidine kinase
MKLFSKPKTVSGKLRRNQLIVTLISLTGLLVILMVFQYFSMMTSMQESLLAKTNIIQESLIPTLAFDDPSAAKDALNALRADVEITRATLWKLDGSVFASYLAADESEISPSFPESEKFITQWKNITITKNIHVNDQVAGKLLIEASTLKFRQSVLAFLFVILAAGTLTLFVTWRQINKITTAIMAPLSELANITQLISKDKNYTLRAHQSSDDEFGALAKSFNEMIGEVARRDEELEGHRDYLDKLVIKRTEKLAEAQKDKEEALQMTALLENSEEGFLTFNKDCIIHEVYSRQCERIFGKPIAGLFLPDLLYPNDLENFDFIQTNLDRVFKHAADPNFQAFYVELLPESLGVEDRSYDLTFKVVSEDRLLLVLSDVTAEKLLMASLDEQRKEVEFIVESVEHKEELFDALHAWKKFNQETLLPLRTETTEINAASISELYRQIHTFKGIFAQQRFIETPKTLHALEDELEDARVEDLIAILARHPIEHAFEKDLDLLHEKLGADFFQFERSVTLKVNEVHALEKRIAEVKHFISDANSTLGQKHLDMLILETQRLRYESLEHMIEPHIRLARQLAARMEKRVDVKIIGDTVMVDPEIYGDMAKSLIHIFRNAIDHGIESPDQRLAAGKDMQAHIRITVSQRNHDIALSITDDGQGLSLERIRAKAVEKGILSAETEISDTDLSQLIFRDQFSTRDVVSDLSGRGVGLSSTMDEIRALGGSIEVVSQPGMYTRFNIHLPIMHAEVTS